MRFFCVAILVVALAVQAPGAEAGWISDMVDKVKSWFGYKKPCVLCLPTPVIHYLEPSVICPSDCEVYVEQEKSYCVKEVCYPEKKCYMWAFCKNKLKCEEKKVAPLSYVCPKKCVFEPKAGLCNCGVVAAPCPKGFEQCPTCPPGSPAGCPYSCASCKNSCPLYAQGHPLYAPAPQQYYVIPTKKGVHYGPQEVGFCDELLDSGKKY